MATGYIKPGVLVVQEIREASPPILLPDQKACIVGPAYQIVRDEYAGEYAFGGVTLDVPGLITGAIVDSSTLKVTIKNAEVSKLTITGVTLNAGDDSYTDSNQDFEALGVKAGDVFYLAGFKTVIRSVSGSTIYFSDTVPSDLGPADADVREIKDVEVSSSDVTYDPETATFTINTSSGTVHSGQIYVSYKALRTDIANELLIFNSLTEVQDQLGEISTENPLAYGVAKALANTTVSVFAMPIESDDFNGYASAFNTLAAEDVYFIVPLTNDQAVIGLLPGHVDSLSKPEVKKWRMAIVSPDLPSEISITSGTGDVTNGVLYDSNAQFLTDVGTGTDYSYYVRINGTDYKVSSVINNNKIQLETPYPPDATGVNYEVVMKVETKADMLKVLKANIEGIRHRRMVAIFPHVLVDENGEEVPGYYGAAALAGLLSGLPSHKPATFMGLGGFKRAPMADLSYFTDDELNEIAGYGYLILTQDTRTSPIYIRHQITTDPTSDYTREISATRTIDYLSVIFENAIKPFIGRYNLIDEVVEMIKDTLKMTAKVLMSLTTAFIGPPLTDFKLGKVQKVTATTLEVEVEVQIPMPLNYVILRIVV